MEKESFLDVSPSEVKTKHDQVPEKDSELKKNNETNEFDDNMKKDKIKYIAGNLNAEDLYALPNKKKQQKKSACDNANLDDTDDKVKELSLDDEENCYDGDEKGKNEDIEGIEDKDANKDLPPGWEKHEDNNGPYYWHIKSGTIQREPPIWPKGQPVELKTPVASTNPHQFLNPSGGMTRSPNNNSFSTMNSLYGSKELMGCRTQVLLDNIYILHR